MSVPIPTTERLARTLEEIKDPRLKKMIERARAGHYDDLQSELAFPIRQLVHDLQEFGLEEMAQRAMNGEWDASLAESQAWFEQEGKGLLGLA